MNDKVPVIVEFPAGPGMVEVAIKSSEIVEKSLWAVDTAMNTIQTMVEKIHSTIDKIDAKPDNVEVEFGLKFNAEAGVVIAKAGLEASINVKLTWENLKK